MTLPPRLYLLSPLQTSMRRRQTPRPHCRTKKFPSRQSLTATAAAQPSAAPSAWTMSPPRWRQGWPAVPTAPAAPAWPASGPKPSSNGPPPSPGVSPPAAAPTRRMRTWRASWGRPPPAACGTSAPSAPTGRPTAGGSTARWTGAGRHCLRPPLVRPTPCRRAPAAGRPRAAGAARGATRAAAVGGHSCAHGRSGCTQRGRWGGWACVRTVVCTWSGGVAARRCGAGCAAARLRFGRLGVRARPPPRRWCRRPTSPRRAALRRVTGGRGRGGWLLRWRGWTRRGLPAGAASHGRSACAGCSPPGAPRWRSCPCGWCGRMRRLTGRCCRWRVLALECSSCLGRRWSQRLAGRCLCCSAAALAAGGTSCARRQRLRQRRALC